MTFFKIFFTKYADFSKTTILTHTAPMPYRGLLGYCYVPKGNPNSVSSFWDNFILNDIFKIFSLNMPISRKLQFWRIQLLCHIGGLLGYCYVPKGNPNSVSSFWDKFILNDIFSNIFSDTINMPISRKLQFLTHSFWAPMPYRRPSRVLLRCQREILIAWVVFEINSFLMTFLKFFH